MGPTLALIWVYGSFLYIFMYQRSDGMREVGKPGVELSLALGGEQVGSKQATVYFQRQRCLESQLVAL